MRRYTDVLAVPILCHLFTEILHSYRLLHSRNLLSLPQIDDKIPTDCYRAYSQRRRYWKDFAKSLILTHRLYLHFFNQLEDVLLIGLLLNIKSLCSNHVLLNLFVHWCFSLHHTQRFAWNSCFINGVFFYVVIVFNLKKNHFCFGEKSLNNLGEFTRRTENTWQHQFIGAFSCDSNESMFLCGMC